MKIIRVWSPIVILIILSLVYLPLAADFKYVGSKSFDKYHYPGCKWPKKISPKNMVTFKTVQEAVKAGFVPCKVCKPPAKNLQDERK